MIKPIQRVYVSSSSLNLEFTFSLGFPNKLFMELKYFNLQKIKKGLNLNLTFQGLI